VIGCPARTFGQRGRIQKIDDMHIRAFRHQHGDGLIAHAAGSTGYYGGFPVEIAHPVASLRSFDRYCSRLCG
jgi:hypothetical protein